MKTIQINRTAYQVAENWNELTPAQYARLIACPRLNDREDRTTDREAAACMVWLGMSQKKWASLTLANWQWGQLRNQFAWLFETRPAGKPPINHFAHRSNNNKTINYHLPADGFQDTTAIEIAFANMAFVDFARPDQADHTALDRLIATLCRPRRADLKKFRRTPDWNGDIREVFSEQRTNENAAHLADLDMPTKLVILDYFERMNAQFLAQYGELFGQGNTREVRYDDGRGWIMLLKNVAKEGHFGDFDKVCVQPAHLLFATLLDDLLDAQEQQAENEKHTPQPTE